MTSCFGFRTQRAPCDSAWRVAHSFSALGSSRNDRKGAVNLWEIARSDANGSSATITGGGWRQLHFGPASLLTKFVGAVAEGWRPEERISRDGLPRPLSRRPVLPSLCQPCKLPPKVRVQSRVLPNAPPPGQAIRRHPGPRSARLGFESERSISACGWPSGSVEQFRRTGIGCVQVQNTGDHLRLQAMKAPLKLPPGSFPDGRWS
jgi:hypothetical protein